MFCLSWDQCQCTLSGAINVNFNVIQILFAVWNACAHANKLTNKNYFTTSSLVKEENHEILLFDKNRALTNSSLFATGRCLAHHPRWRDRSPLLGPRPQRERPLVALLEALLALQWGHEAKRRSQAGRGELGTRGISQNEPLLHWVREFGSIV